MYVLDETSALKDMPKATLRWVSLGWSRGGIPVWVWVELVVWVRIELNSADGKGVFIPRRSMRESLELELLKPEGRKDRKSDIARIHYDSFDCPIAGASV